MNVIGTIGLFLGIGSLILLSYKGINSFIASLIASLIIILTNMMPIWSSFSEFYSVGMRSFAGSYCILFGLAAAYVEILRESGAAESFPENDAWEFDIGGKTIRYARLNRARCRTSVTGLSAGSAGRMQAVIPDDVGVVDDWLAIAKHDNRWNRLERVASMCGRCMTMCPVGREKIEPNEIDRMTALRPFKDD